VREIQYRGRNVGGHLPEDGASGSIAQQQPSIRGDSMKIVTSKVHALVPVAVAGTLLAASPASADDAKSFEIYGFAQTDFIHDFKRVDPSWDDAFRPSKIPTTAGIFGTDGQSSLSVKQSRLGVKGTMPTGEGLPPLDFKFEFDLFGVGADAGQTTFRLRHVYGEWGQWLAGQTNSLFMDGDVFPNTIDYWGPSGMVFYRNVQLRYTPWKTDDSQLSIALERPGNDIDPGQIRTADPALGDRLQNDESLPDLTAQWRMTRGWGHLQVAGILRKVGVEVKADPANNLPANSESQTGWGVNVGAHFNVFGKDAVRLQVVHGNGIASYMNDGGTDLAPDGVPGSLKAKAVPLTGVVAYYDHTWSDRWTSSIGYSFNDVDNTSFQDASAMDRIDYASANLLHTPVQNFMYGVELMWGSRKDKGGATGDNTRVQFTVKYSFGATL
jgi:hypothetical protein